MAALIIARPSKPPPLTPREFEPFNFSEKAVCSNNLSSFFIIQDQSQELKITPPIPNALEPPKLFDFHLNKRKPPNQLSGSCITKRSVSNSMVPSTMNSYPDS
jgi:hypothetical protein